MAFLFLIIFFCFEQRASQQIAIFCFFVNKNNIFPLYSKKIYGKMLCNILNFPMFDRTVFFRLVASRKATPFGGGQERNAICEANCESESMQTARPGRNAKRFDQGTRSPSGIEPKKTMEKVESHKIESLTLGGGEFSDYEKNNDAGHCRRYRYFQNFRMEGFS